jgi:hypothetical protein
VRLEGIGQLKNPLTLSGIEPAISLYNFKIVDKKEILRTVPIIGIYC